MPPIADDQETGQSVLVEAVTALQAADLDYLLVGGLAASCFGRARSSHDIDLLIRPADAPRAYAALADAGFETNETELGWLAKARHRGIQIDLIHRITSEIYINRDMLDHAGWTTFDGRRIRTAAPEDVVVTKASVHSEQTAPHWHDALAILAAGPLD